MKTYKDVFVEELVVRHRPAFAALLRIGAVLAGILLILAFYYLTGMVLGPYANAVFPALFALVCIGVFLVFRYMRLEYEYSFYSGDVDIDRILGKRKRTRLISFSCSDIELMAPYSPEHDNELNGQFDRKLDVRGTGKGERDWFIICNGQDGSRYIIAFSPSERLLDAFRQYVRRGKMKE
ncbi:MAG: hypothetical protein ACOX7I_01835 [Oscillospiraceae bacterium]